MNRKPISNNGLVLFHDDCQTGVKQYPRSPVCCLTRSIIERRTRQDRLRDETNRIFIADVFTNHEREKEMQKRKRNGKIYDTLTGYDFRTGKDKPLKARRSNREKCLECKGGSVAAVRNCKMTDCTMWPGRMGKRPIAT